MKKLLATLPLVAVIGLAAWWSSTAGPDTSAGADDQRFDTPATLSKSISGAERHPSTDPVVAPKPDHEDAAPSEDELDRERIVGVWKQNESGARWLRVREDGTATMFVDPGDSWAAKAIIGDGLTVQIEWSIADGRVLMKSVSGEPSTTFAAVSALYGTDRNREIAQLDDEKFVMLDESDGSPSEWTRVPPNASLPKAIAD